MRSGGDRQPFVIAVDAGGSNTRVGCFSLAGELLALGTGRGGNPNHNDDARDNVAHAIASVLHRAGLQVEDAVALGAGVAGVSRAGSNQGSGENAWTEDFFAVPGLDCPRVVVNDAVIAHRGALAGRAGVIVVAGTGSMILAITEGDEEIESGQFQHYAGGARHLVYDVVERLLTAEPFPDDDPLAGAVLQHWQAEDVHQLRKQLLDCAGSDRNDRKRRYGDLAPQVTALADRSPLADAALCALTFKTAQGVRLLSPSIEKTPAPVALAGALATDVAFSARLGSELGGDPTIGLTEAVLDPLGGAAIIAYQCAQVPTGDQVLGRLASQHADHGWLTIGEPRRP